MAKGRGLTRMAVGMAMRRRTRMMIVKVKNQMKRLKLFHHPKNSGRPRYQKDLADAIE